MGDVKTLPTRRAEAFKAFQGYGVSQAQIFAKLGVQGEADIGQEQLLILRGLLTAIKEGDITPEQAFTGDPVSPTSGGGNGGGGNPILPLWEAERFASELLRWTKAVDAGVKTVDDILTMARTKGTLSEDQEAKIRALVRADAGVSA